MAALRRSALALLPTLALTACGVGEQSAADRTKACEAIAKAVAPAGLGGEPSAAAAGQAAERLDPLLSSLRDIAAHDAAVRLHTHLHNYERALKVDNGKEGEALDKARQDVADLAKACSLPESAFLTGGGA